MHALTSLAILHATYPCYHNSHLSSGFILDPMGQLKAAANSLLFIKLPRTLQNYDNEHTTELCSYHDTQIYFVHYSNYALVLLVLPYWTWTMWIC